MPRKDKIFWKKGGNPGEGNPQGGPGGADFIPFGEKSGRGASQDGTLHFPPMQVRQAPGIAMEDRSPLEGNFDHRQGPGARSLERL